MFWPFGFSQPHSLTQGLHSRMGNKKCDLLVETLSMNHPWEMWKGLLIHELFPFVLHYIFLLAVSCKWILNLCCRLFVVNNTESRYYSLKMKNITQDWDTTQCNKQDTHTAHSKRAAQFIQQCFDSLLHPGISNDTSLVFFFTFSTYNFFHDPLDLRSFFVHNYLNIRIRDNVRDIFKTLHTTKLDICKTNAMMHSIENFQDNSKSDNLKFDHLSVTLMSKRSVNEA